MRFLPIVTQIFLWGAVYQDAALGGQTDDRPATPTTNDRLLPADDDRPGVFQHAGPGRRASPGRFAIGEIKKFLIQPVDMIGFLLLSRVAHKLVYYVVAAGPFALVFFLCRGYFPGWPEPTVLAAFLASLVMAFLLGFFLEAMMGMIGFWFLEVSSLLFVYMLFTFFFSGHMFPIDMLPGGWQTVVDVTPLQYLAYFPAAVFLGKIEGRELAIGLAVELGWVVLLAVACRIAWRRGVARYSGYGG